MSFNYGEIHMFDSVRKDMENNPKPVGMKEGQTQANKFPFAAPINGRRHTVANIWGPFPDGKLPSLPETKEKQIPTSYLPALQIKVFMLDKTQL